MPLRKTPIKPEERRINAGWGGFFFGYFLLAMQKKVSRFPVREPALNQASQRDAIKTNRIRGIKTSFRVVRCLSARNHQGNIGYRKSVGLRILDYIEATC
jgi:hypothetical protein